MSVAEHARALLVRVPSRFRLAALVMGMLVWVWNPSAALADDAPFAVEADESRPEVPALEASEDDTEGQPEEDFAGQPDEDFADQLRDHAWRAIGELLADGRFSEAESALRDFGVQYPDDTRSPVAAAMADALRHALARPTQEVSVTGQAGRLEIVTFSTIWAAGTGAILGFEFINGDDGNGAGKVPLWTAVGGGALGLGLSLALTGDDPPTQSQSGLISTAGIWGYALGAELAFGTPISTCERDSYGWTWCEPSPHAARLVPVFTSSAALVGATLWGRAHPDIPVGDIAVVNAAGAWGFTAALATMALARADSPRAPANFMLAGSVTGLATGLALTPYVSPSRSRMWLINLSGALGVGVAAAIAATAEVDDERAWGGAVLAGEAVGLATGAWLTVGRDHRRRGNRDD